MDNDKDTPQNALADDTASKKKPIVFDEEDGISILNLLLILAERKRFIIASVLVCGILATIIAFIVRPTYTATAVIMPPQQQSSVATALLGQLGNVTGLAGQSLGLKNPADPYVGILSGTTVADAMIKKFKLQELYETDTLVETRKSLALNAGFDAKKFSLIKISVKDRDPKRAADMANAYVDLLQEQNSRLAVTEASQRRLFFEMQLEKEKNNLADAEVEFKKMQEQKGIFQVSSQVEAVITALVRMRAEVAAREVNLQRLKAGATAENPEVLRQEIELNALRKQLKELEASTANRSQGDPLMPTTMVPEAGLEYTRRLREVKYREALFEILAKQYEAARIDEAKEAPVIQVVDRATPPDKKSAPKRSIYVILGIVLGGVVGITVALLSHSLQNPQTAEKVLALKRSLWIRRKE